MPAWSLKPVELRSLDSRDRGAFRRVIIVDGDFAFFLETVIGFVTDQIAVLELGEPYLFIKGHLYLQVFRDSILLLFVFVTFLGVLF